MTDAERPQFATMVVALAETFRQEATPGLMLGYWLGLRDLDLAVVAAGIEAALRDCTFMPSPHEVRERAVEAQAAVDASKKQEGAAALNAARMRCGECCQQTWRPCPLHGGTIACRACRWAYPTLCREHAAEQERLARSFREASRRLGERMDADA